MVILTSSQSPEPVDGETTEYADQQTLETNEVVIVGEKEQVMEEMPECDGRVEATTIQDESMELWDLGTNRSPQIPLSALFDGAGLPPPPDGSVETVSEVEGSRLSKPGAAGVDGSHGSVPQLKDRKRLGNGDGDGDSDGGGNGNGSGGCGLIRKRLKRMKESDDGESDEDHQLSCSAEGSRRLKESLKSGTFVVDEGKKKRFEEKCYGLDKHAEFRYKGKWQVRHSMCSKWVTMLEPYHSVRFGNHVKGCRSMGAKTRNGTIDQFFRLQDPNETRTMAQPSARKQIFAGATIKPKEKSIKSDLPSIPFITKELLCLGLGKDKDNRIEGYITRAIVEGAGSISDTRIAKDLFGDQVKYSELNNKSKLYVAAAQVHQQKWKISHTLGVVFSASCRGKVSDGASDPVCNQCLGLLKLDAFKKALGMKPPPLKNLKFTPHRFRNAATNLGINLAKIQGVSSLLETVSFGNLHDWTLPE